MTKKNNKNSALLVEDFFRNEYGKIVAVISKYVGIESAEDIVQETLMIAIEHWKYNGIPPNPNAWLYTTAKNKALNKFRNLNYEKEYQSQNVELDLGSIEFTNENISDEQLRVMAECCHPSISEEIQITLILKILCGFSISEIASAFCSNNDTINKRLVRGRKKLRQNGLKKEKNIDVSLDLNLDVLLKSIYLLFNEGYFPSKKNQIVRKDLCFEAIRLTEIIAANPSIKAKENAEALLALMYLNSARFEARMSNGSDMVEMELQDRSLWSQELISKGLYHLTQAQKKEFISKYLILASITANHCVSKTYEDTDWKEILSLYNVLLKLENSAIVRLNQLIAFSKVNGSGAAISELLKLKELYLNPIYYSTLATFYKDIKNYKEAISCYKEALAISKNPRDKLFFTNKLEELVPISKSHV